MPTKDDNSDKEKCLDLFLKIGLDERTAKNTIANNKVTNNLTSVIHEVFILSIYMLSSLNSSIFFLYYINQILIHCILWCFKAGVTDGCSRTVGNLIYTVSFIFALCMQHYAA